MKSPVTKIRIAFVGLCLLLAAILLPGARSEAIAAVKKGQPAPPFRVTTTSGQSVSLANYKGYVLVLDFFASWCHPCVESIPHVVELNKKYGKQGLQVLGLSLDETADDFADLIADKRVNYPVALADEDLQTLYGLRSIPFVVVIDKKGIVTGIYMGLTGQSARNLEADIKKLLVE